MQQYNACEDLNPGYYEDGYRYDITYGTWDQTRFYCLSRGGDLAYHGMDSLTTRE